jgi:hypothetical protein
LFAEAGRQLLIDNGVDGNKIFTIVEGIDAIGTYDPEGFDRARSRRDVCVALSLFTLPCMVPYRVRFFRAPRVIICFVLFLLGATVCFAFDLALPMPIADGH